MALTAAGLRLVAVLGQGVAAWRGPRALPAVLLLHLIGEWLMATLPAIGAVAWWQGRRWGHGLLLLGLGAATYASVNAIGWALVNQPALAIGMVVGLLIALGTCAFLIARPGAAFARRTWRRALLMVWLVSCALQIYVVWTVLFIVGVAKNPLLPQIDASLAVFRDVVELVMIVMASSAAWAWKRGWPGWAHAALVALGMLLYAALNTTSQVILVSMPWVGVEAATLVAVLIVVREILLSEATLSEARDVLH